MRSRPGPAGMWRDLGGLLGFRQPAQVGRRTACLEPSPDLRADIGLSRHATSWPGSPGRARGAGRLAGARRARTGSADGSGSRSAGRSGSAGARGSGRAPRSRTRRGAGSTAAGPTCTGARARRRAARSSACSTIRPAYMTAISSASSATTPRSCVMRMIAIPSARCRSSSSSRICAWTVTSSAVVGSSAISSLGSLASAIAIIARWRIPPENSCGYWSTRRSRIGDPDEVEQLDGAVARGRPWTRRGARGSPRRAGRRPCRTGAARTAGPGRSSRCRCRGSAAARRRRRSSRSRPSNRIRARDARVVGRASGPSSSAT